MCRIIRIFVFLLIKIVQVISEDQWHTYWQSVFGKWNNFFDIVLDEPRTYSFLKHYNQDVQMLTNLVTEVRNQGQYYQLPTDASEYTAFDSKVTDLGVFDFIIVGAGAGGSVVASRLSENKDWNVLLVEAGGYKNNITDMPNMYFEVEFTEYNWGFMSVPQKIACQGMVNKQCPMARGRGIGGTTLISGLVYSRGSKIDFDRWANEVHDYRWSYDNVLQKFKRSEHFNPRDYKAPFYNPIHGTKGPLNVEYPIPLSPQFQAWLKAHEEVGYPIADYNAGTGLGTSPAQLNTKNGRRFDAGTAFILPVLKRKNLHVLTHSYVTKIIIDDDVAKGIIFTHHGRIYTAWVSKEVILSAGTFQTPQILMLSGIGLKKHLESLGIHVKKDLEVGNHLRDHACFYGLNYRTHYTEPVEPLEEYVEQFLKGVGPLTIPGNNQGVGFYESQFTKGTGYPDIEIMFIPSNATNDLSQRAFLLTNKTYEDVWKYIDRTRSFVLYIISLHSDSEGTIRLKSKNPFDYPLIDNRFLTDPKGRDIRRIYEGIQIMMKLANTKAMKKIGTTLQGGPLRACKHHKYQSRAYWYCAIRQLTMNIYHPVGTARMGPNPYGGDVVDSECKIHGIKGLRIADGSVFPFPLAGHPTAAIILVGEMVSDFIKEDYFH